MALPGEPILAPTFAASDKIRIGGSPSFVGELSSINIYAPGAYSSPGITKSFFSYFIFWIASCLPTDCPAALGFETPAFCLIKPCDAGYYHSFASRCEGKSNYDICGWYLLRMPKWL